MDRSSLSDADVLPPPKILSNMVNELLVHCSNEDKGCKRTCQRSLLRHHLLESCEYTPVPCPSATCDQFVERRYIDSEKPARCLHELIACRACDVKIPEIEIATHELVCSQRTLKCPDCAVVFTMADIVSHTSECAMARVPCNANNIGCKWVGIRAKLKNHESECTFIALAPVIEKQEDRIARLELENKSLRIQPSLTTTSGMVDSDAFHIFTEHERFRSELEKVSEQLGELEIRHGVLIMNQNVRLKEEVQSMRNAMHGIRHQMHFLLMEHRNWALQNLNSSMITSAAASLSSQTASSSNNAQFSGETSSIGRGTRRENESFRQDVRL